MKRILFLLAGICLSLCLRAESLTATVTAYNKASLSGDAMPDMEVTFTNTYKSKGSVRKGDEAVLTVSGWETCTIKSVTVWMKSNKTSGAGRMAVYAGDELLMSRSGDFKDWQGAGGYSTEYVPFSTTTGLQMQKGGVLTVEIQGSANSIHLDGIDVVYELPEPETQCVHFEWDNGHGRQTTTLCETTAGAGITLPRLVEEGLNISGDWTLVGWSKQPVTEATYAQPFYSQLNKTYYPDGETTLYPVYKEQSAMQLIGQDGERQDGEYVLAMKWDEEETYRMMTGKVTDKNLQSEPCLVDEAEDGNRYLFASSVPEESRYLLRFSNDSVYITHKATDAAIGYTGNKLSATKNKGWKILECDNHSVALFCTFGTDGLGYALYRNVLQAFTYTYTSYQINSNTLHQMWLLFEVSDLPEADKDARYCSFPLSLTATPCISTDGRQPHKYSDGNRILIRRGEHTYDLLGRPID